MVVIVWFVIKLDRRGKLLGGSVLLLFRLAVEILASRRSRPEAGVQGTACLLRTRLEARSILRPATARCSVRITTSLEALTRPVQ